MISNVNEVVFAQAQVGAALSTNSVQKAMFNTVATIALAQILNDMAEDEGTDLTQLLYANSNQNSVSQFVAGMQFATLLNNSNNINNNRYNYALYNRPQVDVNKSMKQFKKADKNKDGELDFNEFRRMYLSKKTQQLGRSLTSAERVRYEAEASNIFEAMSEDGTITKERYADILDTFDSLDGVQDGKIDAISMKRAINRMKVFGDYANVCGGNTLRDLVG